MRRSRIILLFCAVFPLISACGNRNAGTFRGTFGHSPAASSAREILHLTEVSDQGSGACSSTNNDVIDVTLGGSYERRFGLSSTGYRFNAGFYGSR